MTVIHILHVDGDSSSLETLSEKLDREAAPFTISSERRARAALDRLKQEEIDCIVSGYELADSDGLTFLTAVRETHSELPFILFTDTGSEAIASDAITAGATDYLQKGKGEETYTLLANRIENVTERHRSRQERDRVYQALETATEGIGLLDEAGRYIYLNDAYAELYGYDRDELLGERWDRLYPQDETTRFREEILPELRREGSWSGHSRGKRATGTTFPQKLSLTKLETGGHVCVVRDISERRERERQFETLANDLEGMVYRSGYDPDWPIQSVHGNVEEFLGYTSVELESHEVTWRELVHPDDRTDVWEGVRNAVEDSERFELTYRVLDADDRTKWVIERGRGVYDAAGTPTAIEGLITDITDRKCHEEELVWKTKAMDEAPMGIIITDPSQADNPITYVNDHFTEITGYAKDEVLGRNCRFLQGPLTSSDRVEEMRNGISAEEPVEVTLLNYRKEKTPFWNHVQIAPITDEEERLTHFVGFQNDVTSRVEQERRIEVLHRILLHDIRNNLNVILGTLEELTEQPSVEAETIEGVRSPAISLLESCEKARQVELLLESVSFQPEPLNVDRILENGLSHAHSLEETASIETDIQPELSVLAPESVAVAFRELLENAVEHATETAPSVTVTTETERVEFSQHEPPRDAVVVRIEDTNTRISELDRTRLLGNEETPVHHGSGLGFWLINWLVTMSGGLVSHSLREPRGNRISVTLLQATDADETATSEK